MTGGPLTLVIETSNPGSGSPGEVGLARDGALLRARALDPRGRHDDALMPAVRAVCEEEGVAPADLARVAVSVGPGGFSSVRIAVATAKMIGLAVGAGCVPVPSCRVAAVGRAGVVAVAMAGKKDSAWVRVYENGRPLAAGAVETAETMGALRDAFAFGVLVADSHLPDELRDWASGAGVAVEAPSFTADRCRAASEGISEVGPAELSVVYPREPEAVRAWRAARA